MVTDKEVEFALDNQFDGVDSFLLVQDILELQAENKLLQEYTQHKKDCELMDDSETAKRTWKYKLGRRKCTCGLGQALKGK